MEHKEKAFCPAVWFSGFFGLGAVVHTVRFLLKIPVTIGTWHVPLRTSAILVVLFAALSAGLLVLGCRRPCCGSKECR